MVVGDVNDDGDDEFKSSFQSNSLEHPVGVLAPQSLSYLYSYGNRNYRTIIIELRLVE